MPPTADEILAHKFLESIATKVQEVVALQADVSMLKDAAKEWREDHDHVMQARGAAAFIKYATVLMQGLVTAMLIWVVSTLGDLKTAKTTMELTLNNQAGALASLEKKIDERTFLPADWDKVLASVAIIPTLQQQINDLMRLVSSKKEPKIEIKPPAQTIIIQKPDQSRAAMPYQPPSAPGGFINRMIGK